MLKTAAWEKRGAILGKHPRWRPLWVVLQGVCVQR